MAQDILLFVAIVAVFVGLFVWAKQRRKSNALHGNVIDAPPGGSKYPRDREDD